MHAKRGPFKEFPTTRYTHKFTAILPPNFVLITLMIFALLNTVEVKTWEHRIFVTKNELSDEIQCCKQSLQSVEETLLGDLSFSLMLSIDHCLICLHAETKTEMSSVLSDNKSLKEKLQVSLNALR